MNAATVAKTATTTAAVASSTATATASQLTTIQGDVKSVLGAVKDLASIVQATQTKVNVIESRLITVENRVKLLEGTKPGIGAPPPVPVPGKAAKPAAEALDSTAGKVDALRVTMTKCASCHQEGKPVKGKLTLLTAAGERAPLTGDQVAAMTARITEGSMPPPAKQGDVNPIAPLSNEETIALLMDMKSYPRKKDATNEEVIYLRLPADLSSRAPRAVPARKLQFRRLPARR